MSIVVDTVSTPLGEGLSGKDILDATISHIQDNSAVMRGKLAKWLNTLFLRAYNERDWLCLQKSSIETIESNAVVKPTDFGRFISAEGSAWFLSAKHRLTERESFDMADDTTDDPTAIGFVESPTLITFRPGASGTVTLTYYRLMNSVQDTAAPTVWPWKFLPLFERSLLSAYYEYDSDQRGMPSLALDQRELDALKFDDNRQRPFPKQSRKGFLRTR